MGTYRIQRGDTLSALALRFRTTVSQLAKTNHIRDPNLIIAGHTLEVPGSSGSPKSAKKPASTFQPSKSPALRPAPTRPGRVGAAPKTGNAFLDK